MKSSFYGPLLDAGIPRLPSDPGGIFLGWEILGYEVLCQALANRLHMLLPLLGGTPVLVLATWAGSL